MASILSDPEIRAQAFDSLIGSKWFFHHVSQLRAIPRFILIFLSVPFTVIQLILAIIWINNFG